jgi:hypothetical protein
MYNKKHPYIQLIGDLSPALNRFIQPLPHLKLSGWPLFVHFKNILTRVLTVPIKKKKKKKRTKGLIGNISKFW